MLQITDAYDAQSQKSGFISVVLDTSAKSVPVISEIRVRFSNGMELIKSNGDINKLVIMIRKMLS